MQALQGASSTSVTNSDGSTTTSLTYADGSKVTMTSPRAAAHPVPATSSYNFIEQMIQRQAQAISSARHRVAFGQRSEHDDPAIASASDCDLAETIAPRR